MTPRAHNPLLLVWPAVVLGCLLAAPLILMLAMSFWLRVPGGTYEPGFTLDNYRGLFTAFYGARVTWTLMLAALVGLLSVVIAFPATWLICQMQARAQTLWLILILSTLSLSEVLVAFSWSVLLSRSAGVTNLLVAMGLMDAPVALTPSGGAVMTGLVYVTLPYAVLVLYPALSRFDRSLVEAAQSMGATPLRSFFGIVVPLCRPILAATFVLCVVFSLGAFVTPQVLGRPEHWTMAVMVTDAALQRANVPMAAAMAVALLLASLGFVFVSARIAAGVRGTPA
jgi:putative spermidine/putrescine transport system permease protein